MRLHGIIAAAGLTDVERIDECILMRLGDLPLALGDRTGEFAAAAEEAGIMVRPFAGEGARVSIGEPAGNDVFLEVAARFAG